MSKNWSERVLTEFWNQGDKERQLGLNISYLCDRYSVNLAKSQIGFLDFIILPTIQATVSFLPKLEKEIEHLKANKKNWEQKVEFYDK